MGSKSSKSKKGFSSVLAVVALLIIAVMAVGLIIFSNTTSKQTKTFQSHAAANPIQDVDLGLKIIVKSSAKPNKVDIHASWAAAMIYTPDAARLTIGVYDSSNDKSVSDGDRILQGAQGNYDFTGVSLVNGNYYVQLRSITNKTTYRQRKNFEIKNNAASPHALNLQVALTGNTIFATWKTYNTTYQYDLARPGSGQVTQLGYTTKNSISLKLTERGQYTFSVSCYQYNPNLLSNCPKDTYDIVSFSY